MCSSPPQGGGTGTGGAPVVARWPSSSARSRRRRHPSVRVRRSPPFGAGRAGIQNVRKKSTRRSSSRTTVCSPCRTRRRRCSRVQDGRRSAAARRAGHHRPHHHARSDQHRLRRREDDHEQRRFRLMASATDQATGARCPRPARRSRARYSKRPSKGRAILLNISGGSDLGLFEVNEAAEVIHGVAHPDANIIFGASSSTTRWVTRSASR